MIREIEVHENTLRSAFQSMKTEFSPMSKLQYLLQMALLFVLIRNKFSAAKEQGKFVVWLQIYFGEYNCTILRRMLFELSPHYKG